MKYLAFFSAFIMVKNYYIYLAANTSIDDGQMIIHNEYDQILYLDLWANDEIQYTAELSAQSQTVVPFIATCVNKDIEVRSHSLDGTKRMFLKAPWHGNQSGEFHVYLHPQKHSYNSQLKKKPDWNWKLE